MENCVKDLLMKMGHKVNEDALSLIRQCDDWYANRQIEEFHHRKSVQGAEFDLERMSFASGAALMTQTCAKLWRSMPVRGSRGRLSEGY